SLHWLVESPTSAQSAPGAQQSPLSAAALGALPQSGLPHTGPGVSPSCRRLVLPLWLPTRPVGNLRPATPFYRHGLSRRQLALRRGDQRPWQTGETPSNHPPTEGDLPLSLAPRFQRDTRGLSLSASSPNIYPRYAVIGMNYLLRLTPFSIQTRANDLPSLTASSALSSTVVHRR